MPGGDRMSAATQPVAPADTASVDPILLAAADLRDTAATLRETAARFDVTAQQLADTIAATAVLMGEVALYHRAQRLLVDVHDVLRTTTKPTVEEAGWAAAE
jgi:hypothetical protein